MRPIVLSFIINKLGVEVIRPGVGKFCASAKWLNKLARDARLKWRKPYGDARKHPADADAQIHDMILCLAYLMHEHDVPPALTINFDHAPRELWRIGRVLRFTELGFPTSGSQIPGFWSISGKSHTQWCTAHLRTSASEPPWLRPFQNYLRGV